MGFIAECIAMVICFFNKSQNKVTCWLRAVSRKTAISSYLALLPYLQYLMSWIQIRLRQHEEKTPTNY
jgi:hypothetical protein